MSSTAGIRDGEEELLRQGVERAVSKTHCCDLVKKKGGRGREESRLSSFESWKVHAVFRKRIQFAWCRFS